MAQEQQLHHYLNLLRRYLSRLDPADAEEVVREIESHLFDAIEMVEAKGETPNIDKILEGFGEPRQLAGNYVEHILNGAPPPQGFRAIQSVKKGASRALYYAMALFGFGSSIFLFILSLLKFMHPQNVGVWVASHGNSFIVGKVDDSSMMNNEILGLWFSPVALLLAVAIGWLTWKILCLLKDKIV